MTPQSEPLVSLAKHHGALGLLAEAIVGEQVSVEPTLEACWPAVPADPLSPKVLVPPELSKHGEAGRRLHRAFVVHQAVGHEMRKGVELARDRLNQTHRHLTDVLAIVEDRRVAATIDRRYPGASADVAAARAELDELTVGSRTDDVDESRLRWCADASAVASIWRYLSRPDLSQVVPRGLAELIDRGLGAIEAEGASIEQSLHLAAAICAHISTAPIPTFDDSSGEMLNAKEVLGAGALPGADVAVSSVVDRQGAGGGQALGLDELAGSKVMDREADPSQDRISGGLELAMVVSRSADPSPTRVFVYDEWDFRSRVHRPSWCRLVESRLIGDDSSLIDEVRARHRGLRRDIRRRFAHLRPERLVRVHRSTDGDELDLDAVIEARVDRRAGAPAQDRLAIRRDRAERDVVTAFLIDLSASTSAPVKPRTADATSPDKTDETDELVDEQDETDDMLAPLWIMPCQPTQPERRVIDVAKDGVALMSEALNELGDRHAVYGFSGTSRHGVEFVVAKDFGDRVSASSWAAVDAMRPMQYTRMGPAIRHATAKLASEHAATRLLIIVSDGYPQDVDYGRDARDREYGLHDSARALSDAHRAGIATFNLTIDPAGHDYLREMCPDQRYLVIEDIEALPGELAKIWLALRT